MDRQTDTQSKTVYPLLLQSRCMKMTIIVGHLEKDCIICSNKSLSIRREAECFVRVVEGGGGHFNCKKQHQCSEQ